MKILSAIKKNISFSFFFSLLFHFLLLNYLDIVSINQNSEKNSSPTVTKTLRLDSIKFISKKEVAALKMKLNKQVVATEESSDQSAPKNSRFLGEKNQNFDRQTMALKNGSFKEAGLGSNKIGKSSEEDIKSYPQKIAKNKTRQPLSFKELGTFEAAITQYEKPTIKKVMGEANDLGIKNGKAGHQGLAQNNDFVEDVALGDMTNLNTTEYMYYGFYHRIRQKLEQHWGSSIKDKAKNLYRSGRRMPASENMITAVMVTLNDKGHIVDIKIEGTSGVRELDQAAIESFNKAGPFPNPPKGLLVGGRATIQWGFVVKS